MTYNEQLLNDSWKLKRKVIIDRDGNKCQECFNNVYEEHCSKGIIVGEAIGWSSSQISISKGKYVAKVYGIDSKGAYTTFLDGRFNFLPHLSYQVIYKESKGYANIMALKIIDDKDVIIEGRYARYREMGTRGLFSDHTLSVLDKANISEDNWLVTLGLHVHHKYYQKGLLAWEYPNEALVTLCWHCHEKLHEETEVSVLDAAGNEISRLTPCLRCHGAGHFPEYNHVQAGICFECHGAKYKELI